MFKNEVEELAASLNVVIRQNTNGNETDDSKITYENAEITSVGRKLGIEPTDPFMKDEEERQKQIQEERETAKRNEKGLCALYLFLAIGILYLLVLTCSR